MGFSLKQVNESQETLTNDGFFPDIKIGDFQNVFHEISEVDFEKIKFKLKLAMAFINSKLKSLKAKTIEATLIESDTNKIDDSSVLELHYQEAVFAHAKGQLLPLLIDVVSQEKASELESQRAELTREFNGARSQAIRILLGKNRISALVI